MVDVFIRGVVAVTGEFVVAVIGFAGESLLVELNRRYFFRNLLRPDSSSLSGQVKSLLLCYFPNLLTAKSCLFQSKYLLCNCLLGEKMVLLLFIYLFIYLIIIIIYVEDNCSA